MPDARILRGWGEIEAFTRESRPTLVKKQYPVKRDAGGSVWANADEMELHRAKISVNIRKNPKISENDTCTPL